MAEEPFERAGAAPSASSLALYTIPAHRPFGDALAAGLIRRFADDPLALARGLVLLPTNRARQALQAAFVRASGGGLLLPRLIAIGDPESAEAASVALDTADDPDPVPPAIDPLARQMILARLIAERQAAAGRPGDAADAMRLATELAGTLDQLLVEEVPVSRVLALDVGDLQVHWEKALDLFGLLAKAWPEELRRLGRIDLAERRTRLLERLCERWHAHPPQGFVCAAGVTTSAPAVASLLRCVAGLPQGMVVLPDLAIDMPEAQWDALGPHTPDPVTGLSRRSIETHPQFQLKLLLDRMSVARGEFAEWDPPHAAPGASRSRAVAHALTPAAFTGEWTALPPRARDLSGVRAMELATPAEEAQAIALALREALETPGKTAALVTPDRALARRVAAHCRRWGIALDDSAGRPLSILPPGTLLLALAEAGAQDFAPLALLALLKHPLVRSGEGRLPWLEAVRQLDLALRGPRSASGLAGIDAHLAEGLPRDRTVRGAAAVGWREMHRLLAPFEAACRAGEQAPAALIACLRETAEALCGDRLWAGPDGRAAAELLAGLEAEAVHGPSLLAPAPLPSFLATLLDAIAVRPPQGGHPRLAIYGLIEARLQTADLMILGGLNEGVWPGIPAPDPWLAPRIRSTLGLPGLERRIGLAAHDLAAAMGAPEVLLTRARRDATAPTLASRFWLRLEAMAGAGFVRDPALEQLARALDDPRDFAPASRPAPLPPAALRPKTIHVTQVDRLKADPYAFYAAQILRLASLDPVDADASAAWRGTAVHAVLEAWAKHDDCKPEALRDRALALLDDAQTHPLLRALWAPRLLEAIDWIAEQAVRHAAEGRGIAAIEKRGAIDLAGVSLGGRVDRIDRMPDGTLAIIDYKTGKPPSIAAVREGFSLQLGLLGLIAERGGIEGVSGHATGFEYWSLARNRTGGFGYVESPVDPARRDPIPADEFVARAIRNFEEAVAKWLTGTEPFTAKLHPEYAPYAEYDQLMRRDEWYGRD